MGATNDQIVANQHVLMAKLEEILAKMEEMGGSAGTVSNEPKEGDIKKSPFGDSVFRDGKWVSMPAAPPPALIPNGEDDPPGVWDTAISKVLAWVEIPNVGKRWYVYEKANNATLVAEIRPFSDQDIQNFFIRCGRLIPVGLYFHSAFRDLPASWKVLKLIRNPAAPIPEGCKLADDGVNLIPV